MGLFAIGIEGPDRVTVERLQGTDPRKFDGTAVFGRIDQHFSGCQYGRLRSNGGVVLTRCAIAWRSVASSAPSGSTIGSAKRRDQDTTQLQNRTGIQDSCWRLVPAKETAPVRGEI
jgi:hypothetical protein